MRRNNVRMIASDPPGAANVRGIRIIVKTPKLFVV
jgi:hypothetical protein